MPEEENVEGKIFYKCEKCGWLYKSKSTAKKCEEWCNEHSSCNFNITKHAIKIWKKK